MHNTSQKSLISEDYAAIFTAFLNLYLGISGILLIFPDLDLRIGGLTFAKITNAMPLLNTLTLFVWTFAGSYLALWLMKKATLKVYFLGFLTIFFITIFAQLVNSLGVLKSLGIELVLISLFLGLLINNIIGIPNWLKPAIQTELFIKIGLVILGSSIIFKDILQAGTLGLLQSLLVVFGVWYFSFWVSTLFKLDEELRMMLASAVAICGVSAAIATAGAIKGDSKKLSYVISLVLITAIPMMILMPYIAQMVGMPAAVAGAWLGGTIDTTGAVVAAGTVLGEEALKYATVVKFSQNVLLGLAAFIISVYWTYTHKSNTSNKPSFRDIWERFPKFVLGFIFVSLIFSFLLNPETVAQGKSILKDLQTLWFGLAFTCIGLETKFVAIFSMDGGKPAFAFLIAQLFNIVFTLGVAYLIFA